MAGVGAAVEDIMEAIAGGDADIMVAADITVAGRTVAGGTVVDAGMVPDGGGVMEDVCGLAG